MSMHRLGGAIALVYLGAGCSDQAALNENAGQLEVRVAPLTLPNIDLACFDLRVEGAPGVVVWTKGDPALTRHGRDQTQPPVVASGGAGDTGTICSDNFGNGAGGDITYVGTCDATSDSDPTRAGIQNRVTIWVDGLYKAGSPNTDLGEWQDPCPTGCALQIDCNENADSLASFDLTVMREANQGFFDIAVNFEDIFCSAKLDTCYDATRRIELLHGADDTRDWTAVFGLACTAGPTRAGQVTGPNTNIMLSKVEVVCPGSTFTLNPRLAEGNQSVTDGGATLHYGLYYGVEDLDCGQGSGSCQKKYWNLALSLKDLDDAFSGKCTLAFHATANDLGDSANAFSAGLPTGAGRSYPYVAVNVDLLDNNGAASCQRHALNDASQGVKTSYFGTTLGATAPPTMCHQYSGGAPTGTDGGTCGGLIYVPTGTYGQPGVGTNRIQVYKADAVGFAAPIRVIESPALDFPAYCQVVGNELFVSNAGGNNVIVLDKDAAGPVAALRTVSSNAIGSTYGLFVEGGELFVSTYGAGRVAVFPKNATGFVAPSRTLTNADLGQSLGLFVGGGELYTARENIMGYSVHARGASGNTAALRVLTDDRPQARGIWATDSEVFLAAVGSVRVFARDASGAATPLRSFTTDSSGGQLIVKGDEVITISSGGISTYSKAGVLLRTLNVPTLYGVCVE